MRHASTMWPYDYIIHYTRDKHLVRANAELHYSTGVDSVDIDDGTRPCSSFCSICGLVNSNYIFEPVY